ncbi:MULTISPECIES: enoyl-CoA hydratase-related protein [Dietzia]|uniref:enoyl-CoA hydratase-related protein n=1 Tax=Dietzia TaxID=37914 RepID=UPI000D61A8A7|nr:MULTISPECIES: enoyl-CoA hydratase-related protein [Dietzia]MCT1514822.1 enoyl-CoA hydratase-related protein [Dietzia cercidiphylli]MCT1886097.1 enoyl-CoA hydratase-related protein [Dietzia cinnamea]MCT2174935.1 enoyl-CoA hydratase-related protein [Dietzia cinnamea]PWD94717.1 enoyl-CoA hydratase [Dietzia maris]
MNATPAELVRLEVSGGVGRVVLDSPHNRNALSRQLRRQLRDQLAAAVSDDDVRVIVLTHLGPSFCAGADLREIGTASDETEVELGEIVELLWSSPKPVVARVAGPVRAGGVGLASACDIVVASDQISFAFTEVRIGVVPAVISVPVLRRMRRHRAVELFLTGETIDAATAVTDGLINRAVPADQLDAETDRVTRMLMRGGPKALAGTKKLVAESRTDDGRRRMGELNSWSLSFFASDEGVEGRTALMEKREPNWCFTEIRPEASTDDGFSRPQKKITKI